MCTLAHFKRGEVRRQRMSLPCSTMPAVVPATALTEAGAVVCRPTGRRRRRQFSLKDNKLGRAAHPSDFCRE